MSVAVFGLCFAIGLACGSAERLLLPLRRKLGLAFTIPTDIVIAFAAVALHVLVTYFYTDGQFFPYAILSELLGFIIGRSVITRLSRFPSLRARQSHT